MLEVTWEEKDGRTHLKVRLSMKDAAQDGSKVDLSRQRASGEALKEHLTQSLKSAIGMGVALDPMAPNKSSNLVLKSDVTNESNLINGYALVGDDEGEIQAPATAPTVHPLGRGRGSTLPAWMTHSNGPVGMYDEEHDRKKRKDKKREAREQRKQRKLERKKNRGEDRHHRKRRRLSSDSDDGVRRRRRRRNSGHCDGSRNSCSETDDIRASNQSGEKHDHTRSGEIVKCKDPPFETVEEAKKLIARLEGAKER